MRGVLIDKDELYKHYVINQLSSYQIAEKYGCAATTIRNKLLRYNITPETQEKFNQLSDLQKDLVVGSMLGDGHLQKKNNLTLLTVSHCEDQKEYANAKLQIIRNLCNHEDLYFLDRSRETDSKNRQDQYSFTTKSMSCLNTYFDLNIIETLNLLNDNSLTIWFLDDGYHNYPKGKNRNSFYELSISRFSLEEAEYAQEQFLEKFKVRPRLKHDPKWRKADKTLVFSVYDSYRLSYLMKESQFGKLAKETMDYKLIHTVILNRVVTPEKFTVPIKVG
ncbi:LAGLIDADG DNA endonuclease family protein [Paenibacillus sophorae]|uniref:LAGLIDADG DNA endonuclease family protein n=1 Tax=Paenibacillus sophorae TaxID=1333845 RepID=A0A1H8GL69_9BACL|nr:hypothetical protein [Paenibacillus sophorae]QWU14259.1 hypothetical protein KP014_20330 [Paenibacillus sophorae]SEN44494.1 LAGLIDADG DNA endonuclease family protein [Paenibacillus sophorae]